MKSSLEFSAGAQNISDELPKVLPSAKDCNDNITTPVRSHECKACVRFCLVFPSCKWCSLSHCYILGSRTRFVLALRPDIDGLCRWITNRNVELSQRSVCKESVSGGGICLIDGSVEKLLYR